MSNQRHNLPLLDDLFGHADAELAAASLRQTLAAARWRRARRRLAGGTIGFALLGFAWFMLPRHSDVAPLGTAPVATCPRLVHTQSLPEGMLVHTQPGGLNVVTTQPGSFRFVSTRSHEHYFKLVDDDQLLLLAGRSAALIRAAGERAMLIFTGEAELVNPR